MNKTILLLVDYETQNRAQIASLLSRYPAARVVAIKDQGAPDFFYHRLGIAEVWNYHITWPFKEKFRLMRKVRKENFDTAILMGRATDLRQAAVVYASGAPEKLLLKATGRDKWSAHKIRLISLLGSALLRALIFITLLPPLFLLRLIFKIGETGYFSPPPPPAENAPLFKTSSHPPISVVIPNYNGREMLEECLPSVVKAIKEYNPESEIIVVDDASTDDSVSFIRKTFPEILLAPLEKNQGFGKACDTGIRRGRRDLILLLNSDIAATDDFITPLVEHFADTNIFAVQPKALGWDRRTLNFGLNMGKMEQGYVRMWNEADTGNEKYIYRTSPTLYALGGAILFDRRKYFALGGFDRLFYPFRWEDIDLCYRALKRGWKLLYEPKSVVFHKHHGTLEKVFEPDYLNIIEQKNELLFIWKNIHERGWILEHFRKLPRILLSHLISGRYNFPRAIIRAGVQLPEAWKMRTAEKKQCRRPDSQVLEKSLRYYRKFTRRDFQHRRDTRKQILLINPVFPYPPIDGGKTRVYNTIREISRRSDIHLLCYIDPDQKKYLPEMRKVCRSVNTFDWPPPLSYLGRWEEALFPMYYRSYYSDEMRNRLWEILESRDIDLVQCEFDKTMYFVNFVHGIPALYVEHDVSPLFLRGGKNRPLRGWKRVLDWLEWLKSVRWEVVMGRRFTKIVALSEEDREVVKSLLPEKDVGFVKHGTHVKHFVCDYNGVREKTLIFIGSYVHYPNRDAILYFYKKIWPLVKERHPDARLKVVGSHPDGEIEAMGEDPAIEVTGFVDDVRPHIRKAMIFIAPMRKGLGMKGKILEALVMAKPVVTTSIGCHGAGVKPEEHLLVADTPEAFGDCISRFFDNPGLRKKLACRGQTLVKEEYDWSRAAEQMDEIYEQLI